MYIVYVLSTPSRVEVIFICVIILLIIYRFSIRVMPLAAIPRIPEFIFIFTM